MGQKRMALDLASGTSSASRKAKGSAADGSAITAAGVEDTFDVGNSGAGTAVLDFLTVLGFGTSAISEASSVFL